MKLKAYLKQISANKYIKGAYGATSPQILRVDSSKIVCIGGHAELCGIGAENVLKWEPLNF